MLNNRIKKRKKKVPAVNSQWQTAKGNPNPPNDYTGDGEQPPSWQQPGGISAGQTAEASGDTDVELISGGQLCGIVLAAHRLRGGSESSRSVALWFLQCE